MDANQKGRVWSFQYTAAIGMPGRIHGNKLDSNKTVHIRFETINPYRLMIVVVDEGTGFSHDKLDDSTAPENIENPGGRGVFLMSHH